MVSEFRDFLKEYKLLGLAAAFIIGARSGSRKPETRPRWLKCSSFDYKNETKPNCREAYFKVKLHKLLVRQ